MMLYQYECLYLDFIFKVVVFIVVIVFIEWKMWRKFLKFGNKEFESVFLKLISEIGVFKDVVEKVLWECNGDFMLVK